MNALKIPAIVLIVAGVLGLAYVSFNVPVWAGVGAIVIGGAAAVRRKEALVELLHDDSAFCVHEHTVAVAVLACGDVIVRALLTGADDSEGGRPQCDQTVRYRLNGGID